MSGSNSPDQSSNEKRKHARVPIKDHFSLRILIPSVCGNKRLRIKDMTQGSIKFSVDEDDSIKLGLGETVDARLYMDTMTYIGIKLRIAHKSEDGIGCEFIDPTPETASAIEYYLEYVKIASNYFNAGKYHP